MMDIELSVGQIWDRTDSLTSNFFIVKPMDIVLHIDERSVDLKQHKAKDILYHREIVKESKDKRRIIEDVMSCKGVVLR